MSGGIVGALLAPHTPRMAREEGAPEFVRGLIGAAQEVGEALRSLKPDLLVIHSAHWVCTFNWYVTRQQVHQGVCVADEAPDMIPGIPYHRRGDPAYADALIGELSQAGLPCLANDSVHYQWDYGTLVPLLHLDPAGVLPVVALPTVLMADLAECRTVGERVDEAARRIGRRVVFIGSCALSHDLVRVPSQWPSAERTALDDRFVALLTSGRVEEAWEWLPEYNRLAKAEVGGRVLAGLLGALSRMQLPEPGGRQVGPYCPSSGSGNAFVAMGGGLA